MKFEVYRDAQKQYRWRLIASNGRQIADSSEGYKRRVDCIRAIDRIQADAENATIEEMGVKDEN